ncbi:MAG: methionine--tRNA ligase [Clostridiales bacterium]|nr:methionine--tRNA ligase [Clostridiales bacterium]MBD8946272.1 methionine--tRNA ligase [Clostridiales bacterium]
MGKEKYYITTAIAYTSKKPHIGNTFEVVFTDAIARFKKQMGYDVFFLTGTDEHGQKIQIEAEKMGISPKQYVDNVAGEIRKIWDLMGAGYNKFIRTTDDYHEQAVQHIFKKLYDQGDIYKSEYEGWYCVPCESFFTESQLADGCCPDCGREVKKTKEEAYFFKMGKYQDALMKHIEENPEFIQPESRKKEMVNNFLKPGLQDLCVSRTSFSWGIPVEFDPGHVIYVWMDALSNYITALGYDPEKPETELFLKNWPCDVHIIGKDILRFHTIYWPIFLMALGLPLPKQVFGHPWLLFGNDKMSKSKGNVMYADDLVELFGVDAIRYYLLKEMPYAQDGSITYENIIARFNGDLANTLGNLVNRTVAMVHKYFGGVVPNPSHGEFDDELKQTALEAAKAVTEKMNEFKTADALEEIISLARRSNKYIDETMPWALAKDESKKERLGGVLYNLLESIRFIGVLLTPFMPATADSIFGQICAETTAWDSLSAFGATAAGKTIGQGKPLFNRIDEAKKLKEIEASLAKQTAPELEKKQEPEKGERSYISIDDFAKLELKVGLVLESKRVEGADKLLVSKIKVGGEVRQIVSGIAKFRTPEEFVGKKVAVVMNLKPVKFRGVLSEGMILAAGGRNGEPFALLTPDMDIDDGTEIG